MSGGTATAIVEVAVDPPTAFEVFTEEVAAWWRSSESVRFEAGVGGRVLALTADPDAEPVEIGRILVWEPGPRLAFSYHDDTQVEVRFEAAPAGTRVVVEHRGFDRSTSPSIDEDWAGLLGRFADQSRERVLLPRLAEFVTAIAENDVDFFRRNITDDAMCVFPGADGLYDTDSRGHGRPSALREVPGRRPACHRRRHDRRGAHRTGVIQRVDDPSPLVVIEQHVRSTEDQWKLASCRWTPASASHRGDADGW